MDSSAAKSFGEYAQAAKKLLTTVSNRFSALDDIALLAAPKLLRDRFLAFDDIERKHAHLSIDEVLGFIDDLTENRNCRVLLILNTDKLGDKELWDQLREKVIDHELRLDTSPTEAFEIARKIVPTNFVEAIRSSVETCGISNIRVVCKIIRLVNRILADYQDLSAEVLERVIPSSVLLAGIYYKGLEDGPGIDFVMSFSAEAVYIRTASKSRAMEKPTDDDKARARWMVMLQQLKINSVDEFEQLVVEFLQSGLLDDSALKKVVTRYRSEAELLAARRRIEQFFFRCDWHPELTDSELVDEARNLLADVNVLDPFSVTALHDRLMGMSEGSALADEMVKLWVSNFRRDAAGKELGRVEDFNFFGRKVHPLIRAEIDAIYAGQRASKTLLDVVRGIAVRSGWGADEESVMKSATPAEFAALLSSLTGEDLKLFLLKNIDLYANRVTYEKHFGSAMSNFLSACRTICAANSNPRLATLIKNVFADSKLSNDLEPAETKRGALAS
jgi:hypothetical protein